MSPASQGQAALEVERYIGSCLISGRQPYHHPHPHRKDPMQQFGGAPLISMAGPRVPLSRLAVHTQGAPLVLAGRYSAVGPGSNGNPGRPQQPPGARPAKKPVPAKLDGPVSIDALSVASDESSGSNNSENSLPRIIKPRKRRKKDRKPLAPAVGDAKPEDPTTTTPPQQQQQQQQQQQYQPQSNPTFSGGKPTYHQPTYDYYNKNNGPHHRRPMNGRPQQQQQQQNDPVVDSRQQQQQQRGYGQQQQQQQQRHVQVKVLDDNRNVIVPIPVCQAKTANYATGPPGAGFEEPCRYCDSAATLIWDVSDFAHHHHHHHHHHRFSQVPVFLARPLLCQDALFDGAPCLRLRPEPQQRPDALRRSWSDPSSYFAGDEGPPRPDVGVIGDRGQARSSWRGADASSSCSPSPPCSPAPAPAPATPGGPLEVSTEIVTSPNGHRDLEIKFYSSSPSAAAPLRVDEFGCFSFPEEDEDIWRYHETKLQQDFRSLLQAEE